MRSALAVAAAVATLTGCGGGGDESGYPEESVEAFVATCSKQPGASREA